MDDQNDANYIRLPTAVFIALFSGTSLFGAGAYGVLGPSSNDQLASLNKGVSENRETARAALKLATQNNAETNSNRTLIFDTTRSRYSAEDATKDFREQETRHLQIERRLMLIERELDSLRGTL